jgi:hypothetical protein
MEEEETSMTNEQHAKMADHVILALALGFIIVGIIIQLGFL